MENSEACAWGRIYATIDRALRRNGRGLTDAELDNVSRCPQYMFGMVMRRALANRAIGDFDHAVIALLSGGIEAREVDGGTELGLEQMGIVSAELMCFDPNKAFVPTSDAADELGVTESRVRQLCARGQLSHIKTAEGLYVLREDVDRRASSTPSAGRPSVG